MEISQTFLEEYAHRAMKSEMLIPTTIDEIDAKIIEMAWQYFCVQQVQGTRPSMPDKYIELYDDLCKIFATFADVGTNYKQLTVRFNFMQDELFIICDKNHEIIPKDIPAVITGTATISRETLDEFNKNLASGNQYGRFIILTLSY